MTFMNQISSLKNKVQFQDLGFIDYQQAWDYQETLFSQVVAHKRNQREVENPLPNSHYLLFCEHNPVFTLGKSGSLDNLLITEQGLKANGIDFYKINRGGDITYHGPGQIVGYPILDLDEFFTDIHKYMRFLEEVIIRTIAEYGLSGERLKGSTGVWLDVDSPSRIRKICALGVRASRWVTMHGWAFNVNTNLNYFNHIIPCGINDKAVTSLSKELGQDVNMDEAKSKVKKHFQQVFNCQLVGTNIPNS